MVDEPEQKEAVPEMTGAAGSARMLVVTKALLAEQFEAFLTFTLKVPEVLTSGNFALIEQWRSEQALSRTRERRPDLLGE